MTPVIIGAVSDRSAVPASVVGVVTVSYSSFEVLEGFLSSLARALSTRPEVVVVDNAADAAVATLSRRVGAAYLARPENPGYGAAINAGVDALPGSVEWVLVSNPDVVLHGGAVDRLLAVGRSDARIGSIGPRVLNGDGSTYPSARAIPSLRTGVGHALFANIWLDNPWSRAYRDTSADPERARSAGWLSGSCLLVRRSAFAEIGGFDEKFFMYFEDVDLGLRLGRADYLNWFEPSAVVTHSGAHSTSAHSAAMVAAHHRSARLFIAKKYPGLWLSPVRAILQVGLAIRSAILQRRVRGPTPPGSRRKRNAS